ncbi:MAG: phenylalanine--tRNA ligase subunit beta [Prevotella sp.]|nr:phenylalanine--tRNA ligase subunit beta [Prevotella sp.]
MNISYKWLKEYVDFDLSPQETADALTSTGLEVDALEERPAVKGGLQGLYVGQVLTCEPHPNSDHLHVTTVGLGRPVPSQIVCGAPNVAAGQKVIVADIGCVLYDGNKEIVIKRSKLRGIESCGMICAEDEIGLGKSHAGIMVLPGDAKVGMPAAEYFGLESDWVIEIDITANRADALSHWGVARDLYAWLRRNGYATSLHRPDCSAFRVDNEDLQIDMEIANPDACLRYAGVSITDCDVKESPDWLKERLTVVGLRPINNIVDITNYIMMAYGQPLHCFDADMVKGRKIVARTLDEGTPFVTLDGVEHRLSAQDLAICNAEEPMCIAGVFGGKGSGTYETTRNVVLESAYFHPTYIRKSARRHGLSTDASYRFERGVDPNGQIYALKQAAIMCREIAGGKVSMQIKDVYPNPIKNAVVSLSYDYADRLIGKKIERDIIKSIATDLDMKILEETSGGLTLEVPAYRVDVRRPCDVVEEILRIYGYNNVEIPSVLHSSLISPEEQDREHRFENIIGEQLAGSGFNEILNNSLTKTSYYKDLNAYTAETTVAVVNPLSADLGVMRQTLLFGGLESIAHNANRRNANLRFFEFGNCYHYAPEKYSDDCPVKAYSEEKHLALWVTGKRIEGSWAHPDEDSSYFELRAYVENVLARAGIRRGMTVCESSTNNIFSAGIEIRSRAGRVLAETGIVAGNLQIAADIAAPVYFADIHWDELMKVVSRNKPEYTELCKYPSVSRDLALLINKDVEFERIERAAYSAEKKLLTNVELFDVYEGKNLPEGKKSYAVNFILQDTEKTMSDKAIDAAMTRIITAIKAQTGAELR